MSTNKPDILVLVETKISGVKQIELSKKWAFRDRIEWNGSHWTKWWHLVAME